MVGIPQLHDKLSTLRLISLYISSGGMHDRAASRSRAIVIILLISSLSALERSVSGSLEIG